MRQYRVLVTAALIFSTAVAGAMPIAQTRYGQACLRVEARPKPWNVKDPATLWTAERRLAEAGVGARWIQMVNDWGTPLLRNDFLPCPYPDADKYETFLKQWVQTIHAAGLPALSWYPLIFCEEGWKQHPDWRQSSLLPWPPGKAKDITCCINSPYGDAMIHYCIDAIKRLNLDGIWFDGAAMSPIWERPVPLTCVCQYCRERFKRDTGLEIPSRVDWNDPVFRRWIAWRYDVFGGYIARLANAIRAACPNVAVVVNHYHRPGVPWNSAIPLNPYPADIITGSEAFSPDTLDLTVRLCRAYGRSQSEVWRQFNTDDTPEANAETLLQHALICYDDGGEASFGGNLFSPRMAQTAALISPIMKAVHPYVGGPTLPFAAIHVSQQTETFYFGRESYDSALVDPYFTALGNWTVGLGEMHVPPDYVFDADFTPAKLSRYHVLLMPLSLALTDAQCATALDFARRGGALLLGMGAGQLDAEGEPRRDNRLGETLGFNFDGLPRADGADAVSVTLTPVSSGTPMTISGRHTILGLTSKSWRVLYKDEGRPAIAERQFGRGRVVVAGVDALRTFGSTPAFGGKTRMDVTDETAAAGKWSLKYVDDAIAPQPFYPDLENKLLPFASPDFTGGELSCDLRVGPRADVSIEVRSTIEPIAGPVVGIHDGKAFVAGGQEICAVPYDQWFHVTIAYDFAAGGKPASYRATVKLADGTRHTATSACPTSAYRRTDWFVIYGAGREHATFYLDNLRLARRKPDGVAETVLSLDFETGPKTFAASTSLTDILAIAILHQTPPPVAVDAPAAVRVGLFAPSDHRILVHLHNRDAQRTDWQQTTGPAATLRCTFPVRKARLAISGKMLTVRDKHTIIVPHVGLYQVVEIER